MGTSGGPNFEGIVKSHADYVRSRYQMSFMASHERCERDVNMTERFLTSTASALSDS